MEQLIFSFFATACFGFIFNAPKRMLIQCGLVGVAGWTVYSMLMNIGADLILATFAGGFTVAFCGYVLSRLHKMPIIIFVVAGLIPLVPGGAAYDAMRHVVSNNYAEAIPLALKAFIVSGSLAMGLAFTEVFTRVMQQLFTASKNLFQRK